MQLTQEIMTNFQTLADDYLNLTPPVTNKFAAQIVNERIIMTLQQATANPSGDYYDEGIAILTTLLPHKDIIISTLSSASVDTARSLFELVEG